MSDTDAERALYAFRVWLAGRGVPADDLDEREICRQMVPHLGYALDTMSCVRFLPGSWDKRFYRSMEAHFLSGGQAPIVSIRQAAMICKLRHKYRRQCGPSPLPAWWSEEIPA